MAASEVSARLFRSVDATDRSGDMGAQAAQYLLCECGAEFAHRRLAWIENEGSFQDVVIILADRDPALLEHGQACALQLRWIDTDSSRR